MPIQSCLKSTPSTFQTDRRVRFAEPLATAFQEPTPPRPDTKRLATCAERLTRRRLELRRPDLATASCAAPVVSLPHLPFERPAQLAHLALEQHKSMRDTGARWRLAPSDKDKGYAPGPLETLGQGLHIDLGGVIDDVEDSALMRYGSYAAMTGGVLVFFPVAAVVLCSYASLYAGYWGVKQMQHLGAASARAVLGLPAAGLPRPPSPPQQEAPNRVSSQGWTTFTYLDDGDDDIL